MPQRRRPGRPRLDPDNPTVSVHVRLPAKQYDDASKAARDRRMSVPELVRRALRDALKTDPLK
jgi:hypothetical protein